MPDINLFINAKDTSSPAFKSAETNVTNLSNQAEAAGGKLSTMGVALGTAIGTVVGNGVTAAISKLGELVGSVVTTGVNFDNMKQQAQIAFTTMLGSGQQAKAFLDNLQAFAAKTPFEFPDLLMASQRMLAMGFQSSQVLPTLTAIGDAVAGLGGNSQMVDRVTTALGQMQAKGKATGEEMMQLTEAGIPAWEFLAKKIGVSIPEAMKMVTAGTVDANTAITALVDGMNTKFGGLMEQQSKTFGGLFSTIKDTFAQVSGQVMQPVFELLSRGLQSVVDWTSKPEFTAGVKALAEWIQNVSDKVAEWISGAWPRAIEALRSVQSIVNLLATGDFRGGIFGMQEDDPFINALLTARQAGVWLYEQARKLVTIFTDWAKSALPPVVEGLRFVFEHMTSVVDAVKTAIRPITDAITKYVKFGDVMKALGLLLAGPVLAAFGGILLGLAQFLAPIAAVVAAVAALRIAWQNDFLGIRTFTQTQFTRLVEWFKTESGIWQGDWESTLAYIGKKVEHFFKYDIYNFIVGGWAEIKYQWTTITTKIRDQAVKWVDELLQTYEHWASVVQFHFEHTKDLILQYWKEWTDPTKKAIEDWYGVTKGKLENFVGWIVGDFGFISINNKVIPLWEELVTWWETNIDPWVQYGKDLVQGLYDGMVEIWNNLSEWFTGVWGTLTDNFKKFFGIASPSTLFRSYGQYMMDGLADGIKAQSARVQAEIDSVSNSLTTKMAMLKGAIVKDMTDIINHTATGMVFLPGVTNLPKTGGGTATTGAASGANAVPTQAITTLGQALGTDTVTASALGQTVDLLGGLTLQTVDLAQTKANTEKALETSAKTLSDFISGIGDFLTGTLTGAGSVFANFKYQEENAYSAGTLQEYLNSEAAKTKGELKTLYQGLQNSIADILGVNTSELSVTGADSQRLVDRIASLVGGTDAKTNMEFISNLLQEAVDFRNLANYGTGADYYANVLPTDTRLTGGNTASTTNYNITLQGSNNGNADVLGLVQLLGSLQAGATP